MPLTICDLCNNPLTPSTYVTLRVDGIREKLQLHRECIDTFLRCKGNFQSLPDGRLKRALVLHSDNGTIIQVYDKEITRKQRAHIMDGLKQSHDIGMQHIHDLAVLFYGLPKPNINEYYTLNNESKLVLMRKLPNV